MDVFFNSEGFDTIGFEESVWRRPAGGKYSDDIYVSVHVDYCLIVCKSATVMAAAAKLSIEHDKPIYLDYYNDSLEKKCCIGVQGTTKYLVKTNDEYTSTIQSVFKCETCYIVMTENSLYIVDASIPIKRVMPSKEETSQ